MDSVCTSFIKINKIFVKTVKKKKKELNIHEFFLLSPLGQPGEKREELRRLEWTPSPVSYTRTTDVRGLDCTHEAPLSLYPR